MQITRPDPSLPDPFGTLPRRGPVPLFVWLGLFVAWFAALGWLALAYPGR